MFPLLNQRYEQVQLLAQGSDTEVWEGFDTHQQQPVLIKVYLPESLQDWKRIQLIEREARILAQINHIEIPGFVDFFALGSEGQQTLYLVTFWVNGVTLSHKLEQGWQPSLKEVLDIACKILELLVYIHAFNPPLVHRDIKPSNLMLNLWQRVYLVDFGGAQEVLSSQGAGGSTLVGTVGYMAPEQLQGRAVPATDIYGLGATLLQLLSRTPPAEAGSEAQIQQLDQLSRSVDHDLIRWLKALLAPNPHQRYASAKDALKDLDMLRGRDFTQRTFFYPQNHRAQIPEIIHSLTLTERSKEDQALLSGSLLEGRYEVSQLIGAGTHSHVYAGRILHSDRSVILKELCIERVEEWKNIELFEREMKTQQRLKHPRIPAYIDSFQIREGERVSWFLVTAAVDGETLDQRLERGWRPTDEAVWQIADQLLEILDYLHSQEPPLIHRDIKPNNVLITPDNQVWLIDFGAVQSRLWAQGGGGSTIIGTFGYMAPEQFSGQAWPESDLYALGATLIRLLSRRHPIEIPLEGTGLNFQPFVSCPAFYVAWLATLLQPLRPQRFATAHEALRLLRDAANQGDASLHWLKQQKQVSTPEALGRRKRLLPSRISLEQVAHFLKDSETLEVKAEGGQVHIHCIEDQQLQEKLRDLDLLSFFPKNPENQRYVSPWRRQIKDESGNNQTDAGTAVLILGLSAAILCALMGIIFLSEGVLLWGVPLLILPFIGAVAAGGYSYRRQQRQKAQQEAGGFLPVAYQDYHPRISSNQEIGPKASLLSNACLTVDSQGVRLNHQPPDDRVYAESFYVPWSDISALELTPWLPEYPHWDALLGHRRLHQLSMQTVRRLPAYPDIFWSTGTSAKAHAPPDSLRLSLSEVNAESLLQILQGLQRQYTHRK